MRDARVPGIGGSDVAALLGLDDRRDQFSVWCDIFGEGERARATARMINAKHLEEPLITKVYPEWTGREARYFDQTVRSEKYEFARITPDGFCLHDDRGVEGKFVSWDQAHLWDEGPEGAPVNYQLQCHYYMAMTDFPRWDMIALRGIDVPLVYEFTRDPELEGNMLAVVEKFWVDHVLTKKRPPFGPSDDSARWLKARFPRHRTRIRKAEAHEVVLLEQYAQARSEADDAVSEKTRLEHELKGAVGDAEGIEWDRGRFTWKNVKDTVRTDWEAISRRFMDSWEQENRDRLIAEFSVPVPGVRRIHFTCKEA